MYYYVQNSFLLSFQNIKGTYEKELLTYVSEQPFSEFFFAFTLTWVCVGSGINIRVGKRYDDTSLLSFLMETFIWIENIFLSIRRLLFLPLSLLTRMLLLLEI